MVDTKQSPDHQPNRLTAAEPIWSANFTLRAHRSSGAILNWQDDNPVTVGAGSPPKLSATFRVAQSQRQPAPEAGTAATADPLDDQQLAGLYANYATHTPDA